MAPDEGLAAFTARWQVIGCRGQLKEGAMASFDSKTISHIHHELHSHLPSEPALRTKALESLLAEKQLIDPAAVDAWIEMYRDEIGPKRGAAVVARAWRDSAFKARLLADATVAIGEFGFAGHATGHLQAVENTGEVHNLVVCTLCSCYPFSILGLSPSWYKSNEYRARAVRDPRGVLKEFGVELVVSEAVVTHAGFDLSTFPRHEVEIRGKREMLAVRTLASAAELPASPAAPVRRPETAGA